MGLLQWLFDDDGGKALQDLRNGNDPIKTANGEGYDKMSTLAVIDKMNSEILMLEELFLKKQRGEPYTLPPYEEAGPIPTCKSGGFDIKDVDAYLTELDYRIVELRAEL